MLRAFILSVVAVISCLAAAQTDTPLTGTVIGTELSYDYSSGRQSTTVNTRENAFDGDLSTYFASYQRSGTWVGLDLGAPHVITRVGWSPRNDAFGPRRTQLSVFEGANREDFLDAVPLFMTSEQGEVGSMSYADVRVTRAFRYVRYVGPNDSRCNVAEVAFYGDLSEGSDDRFYQLTNLPVVVVHVEDAREPVNKTTELPAYVSIISKDGAKILSDTCSFRLRGNASKDFPKKPYRLKFDQKHHVLGSPAKAKKWTLINNYGDKTLMRNILAFDLSRRLGLAYTPFCQPVDLVVNGEYKGCYQLCDQIEVHKDRVEIDEMDATCSNGDELTGGYLIEVDAYAYDEACYFYSNKGNPVTIKSPDSDVILSAQKNYIKRAFNNLETALFASNYKDETRGYRRYLDLDSFLRHFLVGELSGNTDTYWSMYLYKPRSEEQFFVGPVWDFDLAFENDNRTYPICNQQDYIYASKGSYAGEMRSFVNRIVKTDANASRQLKDMWAELRLSRVIDVDSLQSLVDQQAELLESSQQLNFKRWNIMNSYVHQNPRLWGSYANEVKNVRDYIARRVQWMDKKLGFDPEQLGIHSVSPDESSSDQQIFDMMGRQHETLQRGLNIVNGQKVLLIR